MKTETFELWEKDIPYYIGGETPKITYYPVYPRSSKGGKGTVIICPGGGYSGRAPHEGRGYAEYLNSQGLDAFVLDYRVKPNVYPAALCDARRAIRFVRYNAEKFGIDPEKIAIMGSSAGGHLAAHASTFIGGFEEETGDDIDKMCYIPNGQILCYPVLDRAGHSGSYNNLLQDKVDELEKLRTEQGRLAVKAVLVLRDILTPEQAEKAGELFSGRGMRRPGGEHRRPRPNGGEGRRPRPGADKPAADK
jgi:hypothetical protein